MTELERSLYETHRIPFTFITMATGVVLLIVGLML